MVKGDDIEDRLIDFAVRVLTLCEKLPADHSAGSHSQFKHPNGKSDREKH